MRKWIVGAVVGVGMMVGLLGCGGEPAAPEYVVDKTYWYIQTYMKDDPTLREFVERSDGLREREHGEWRPQQTPRPEYIIGPDGRFIRK